MNQTISLDADMADLLQSHVALTGLSLSELISRLLSAHLPELHELLALVSAHPEIRERAANVLQSFGPESLADGIKRIAPAHYETLGQQFARQVAQLVARSSALH